MRVLDDQTVEAGGRVPARLNNGCFDNLVDVLIAGWSSGKPSRVDDADEGARHAEERLDHA